MNYPKQYVVAPNREPNDFPAAQEQKNSIFLAGSITGAGNWQTDTANKLRSRFHVFNPRRDNFNVSDPKVEREQITWEFSYLNYCRNILFWFAPETLAPITLFELGTVLELGFRGEKNIFIGIHPDYKRKNDVLIQTELRAPNLLKNIVFDIDELCDIVVTSK